MNSLNARGKNSFAEQVWL